MFYKILSMFWLIFGMVLIFTGGTFTEATLCFVMGGIFTIIDKLESKQ